jgi:hypothetical protein
VEGAPADSHAHIRLTRQAYALVVMLLTRLDAAHDHIESLDRALQSDDTDLAQMTSNQLQQVWSDIYMTILVLEQISGHTESHARNAFAASQRAARVPLALARSLISRLPFAQHNIKLRRQCLVLKP